MGREENNMLRKAETRPGLQAAGREHEDGCIIARARDFALAVAVATAVLVPAWALLMRAMYAVAARMHGWC